MASSSLPPIESIKSLTARINSQSPPFIGIHTEAGLTILESSKLRKYFAVKPLIVDRIEVDPLDDKAIVLRGGTSKSIWYHVSTPFYEIRQKQWAWAERQRARREKPKTTPLERRELKKAAIEAQCEAEIEVERMPELEVA